MFATFSSGLKVKTQVEHPESGKGGRRTSNVEKLFPPEAVWGRRKSQVEELSTPERGWGRRTSLCDGRRHNGGSLESTQQRTSEGKNGLNMSGTTGSMQNNPMMLKPSEDKTPQNLESSSPRAPRKKLTVSTITQQGGTTKPSQIQQTNPSFSKIDTGSMTNSQLRISIPHNEYRKTGNGSPSPTYMQSPSMYSRSGYEIARLKWLQRRDYRRKSLLIMTAFNMIAGSAMILLYFLGPSYPGHFGTLREGWNGIRNLLVENSPIYSNLCPSSDVQQANDSILNSGLITGTVVLFLQPVAAYSIYGKLVERGALCQLLSSVMCAITSLGAVIVIFLDMDFISGCCMELAHRCEQSNMCTPIIQTCCIGTDVKSYCSNQTYQYLVLIMAFIVTISSQAQAVMSCTAGCRCWLDADPEKQELITWLATPRGTVTSPSGRTTILPWSSSNPSLGSPQWSPRTIPSPSGPPRMAMQQWHPSPPCSHTPPSSGKHKEDHSLQQPNGAAVVVRNRRGSIGTCGTSFVVSRETKGAPSGCVPSHVLLK